MLLRVPEGMEVPYTTPEEEIGAVNDMLKVLKSKIRTVPLQTGNVYPINQNVQPVMIVK